MESVNLLLVVTDLHILVVYDDRPFQNRRILDNEISKLINGHGIDINLVVLDYLASFGDDIITAKIASFEEILDFLVVKHDIEDILFHILDIVVFKIVFSFSTG